MKRNYTICIAFALALAFGACGHNHNHDGHEGHIHEQHDHDGHDHDAEGHDHDTEGEEHDHDHEGHGHEGHDAEIPLSDKEAARLGVKTTKLSPASFAETLRVGGAVERASEGEFVVSAPRSGRFSPSSLLQVGRRVSAGQSLGTVSPAGTEGGDQVAAARARYAAAEREVERLRPLVATGGVSRAEFQRAEAELGAAKAELGSGVSSSASSPGSGVVTSVIARAGEYVERGQTLAVVSKNTNLTLRADVPARHASFARRASSANFRQEGMTEALSLSSTGGRRLDAETATASEGYIPVRFAFSNNGTAVPGAYAEIWLIGPERPGVISVPVEAIVEIQGVKYVFEKVHEGQYAKRRIQTGGTDGRRVEVVSGVDEGAEIVSDGARVIRMAEISHIAPPAHTHNH